MDNRKIIKLSFVKKLQKRIKEHPHLIQVILGPRQVGKTTTIHHYLKKDFLYFSADKVFNTGADWILSLWNQALEQKKHLIIDEIQKCENWAEIIKKLWDAKEKKKLPLNCILMGSSSLELQKGLTESLAGRYQLNLVHHWNYAESYKLRQLSLDDYLKYGGYPGSYRFFESEDWVSYVRDSIIMNVIEKDILQFHRVKSPALFKQVFEILIQHPCREISYTKLLGQIQDRGNVDLVKYYIQLYEGAFLLKALPKFSPDKIKLKASSPKIITLAPCLYYLNTLEEYSPEEKGHVFEALVGQILNTTDAHLYYWRQGDFEVDYVVKRGKRVYAIEVKSGNNTKAKSMAKFLQRYPQAHPVFITRENYLKFEKNPLGFLAAHL